MTLPRAVGELPPGKRPWLFHEIFWLLRKSVHFLESFWDRQCSAVRNRTGIQWPLIHRKCYETHSKSILPQLSTGWVSAHLVSVPFPGSVRRKCFTNTSHTRSWSVPVNGFPGISRFRGYTPPSLRRGSSNSLLAFFPNVPLKAKGLMCFLLGFKWKSRHFPL